jgi:hypothetical protein
VLKQGEIMQVDSARFVAGMEEQLLIARQARHANTIKRTPVEGFSQIFEVPAAEIGIWRPASRSLP